MYNQLVIDSFKSLKCNSLFVVAFAQTLCQIGQQIIVKDNNVITLLYIACKPLFVLHPPYTEYTPTHNHTHTHTFRPVGRIIFGKNYIFPKPATTKISFRFI